MSNDSNFDGHTFSARGKEPQGCHSLCMGSHPAQYSVLQLSARLQSSGEVQESGLELVLWQCLRQLNYVSDSRAHEPLMLHI
eukprot:2446909-Amphidinium_carterae.1